MPQMTRIISPLKGVNRAFARESQPEDTCWDALNAMPFDRYGRLRVAQRTGLGQLPAMQNSPTDDVRLLHVASSAHTPNITGLTTVFSEPFTYSDGALTGNGGWTADAGADPSLNVVSDTVVGTGTDFFNANRQTTALAAWNPNAADWTFTFTVKMEKNSAPFQTQEAFISIGDPSGANFVFDLSLDAKNADTTTIDSVTFQTNAGGFDSPSAVPFTFGVAHTVKITYTVATTTMSLYFDNVLVTTLVDTGALDVANKTLYLSSTNPAGNANWKVTFDSLLLTTGSATAANAERTALNLIAVSGTGTWFGVPTVMTEVSNDSTYPISASAPFLSAATLFNYTYIVDGVNIRRLNLTTAAFVTFTESAGTAPKDCTIAVNWRGRLVLSGAPSDPQNFFASRAGDPLDWDTSQTDAATAFAGNAAASGKIGQPIHALIPLTDDIMLIGCEQSVWAVRGDPADGGSIDLLSDIIGVASQTSWCRGPDGEVLIVGPRGFFEISATAARSGYAAAQSPFVEISKLTYPQYFIGIDRSQTYINLMYDADRKGVWIFLAPLDGASALTSMFYDLRVKTQGSMGGMWPQRFTNQFNAGPVQAVWWDGYSTDTRYPVLGGFDGFLYATNSTNRSDNGGLIDTYVTFGPFHPSDGASRWTGTTIDFGELSATDATQNALRWNANVTMRAGKTAYDVTEGTPTNSASVSFPLDKRTKTLRQRLRGEWFTFHLYNNAVNQYFSFETLAFEFDAAGRERRQH